MLHITEDTPADMLSGAMDLTIHLPTGKAVKMCVERRTPMMDLLVQVTTNHQLQITNYTLQPLQTSSNDSCPEKVLSYYPNTPIGALDTQHIKVIPKTRTLPSSRNAPPGSKPFETTFRLKVHLPRNQLYVTRVSKHVHIEDIMRKVCEEKSLDPNKYEVRHPGNLDEVLDPKLTLNDYMITEINLVVKGSKTNSQIFTSEDIMSLRKEEERKPASNKTGGVFNLLFRRGKSNNVSTAPPNNKDHTPPVYKEYPTSKPTVPPTQQNETKLTTEPPKEKPKVPQRKRRPAPKPPQPADKHQPPTETPPPEEPVQMRNGSVISDASNASETGAKHESGLTICHSRHSSDSSGYHETSILSDQCNTSLPRRNRLEEQRTMGVKLNRYSESTGNLTKMTSHSRSTSSLIFPGRKKKAAPPPPKPLQKFTSSATNLESLSPVVASQSPLSSSSSKTDLSLASQGTQKTTNPPPVPRRRKGTIPKTKPSISLEEEESILDSSIGNDDLSQYTEESLYSCPYQTEGTVVKDTPDNSRPPSNMSTIDILKSLEYLNLDDQGNEIKPPEIIGVLPKSQQIQEEENSSEDPVLTKRPFILNLVDKNVDDDNASVATESPVRNEEISIISDISSCDVSPMKRQFQKEISVSSVKSSESILFVEGRIRRWGSWEKLNQSSSPSPTQEGPIVKKNLELKDVAKDKQENEENSINSSQKEEITEHETVTKPNILTCPEEEQKKHWEPNNSDILKEEDGYTRERGCDGVVTDTDLSSTSSHPAHKTLVPIGKSFTNVQIGPPIQEKEVVITDNIYTSDVLNEISLEDVERYKNYGNSPDSGNSSEISEKSKLDEELNCPEVLDGLVTNGEVIEEWQLPSPPKAFKDNLPNGHTEGDVETDSVINTELIEKLERIEKEQAVQKNASSIDDSELILSKLSLENLEKRKSLVYNRELATSLKLSYESEAMKRAVPTLESSQPKYPEKTEDLEKPPSKKEEAKVKQSTLPNFKITTYDEPKQIKVFEDDTIRSNSDFSGKSLSLNRASALQKDGLGRSMEAIKPKDAEHRMFRPKGEHYRRPVNRSGSFSADHNEWTSSKPVARSKSQVALRRVDRKVNEAGNLSKSSSLFDVSGLQSLEVMKKIQNKLNTPTTSMETLSKVGSENKVEVTKKTSEIDEAPTRKYQYTGPPSVNMGTWSERPKQAVSVKEDADYKLGHGTNNRHFKTTIQNGIKPSEDQRQKYTNDYVAKPFEQRVTITCNGSSYQPNDFNVLVKQEDQIRGIPEQTHDSVYRTFNRNTSSQRPHSVAFSSDFDISRVPVVRSVELKKTFKENTSVIHLNQSNDHFHSNGFPDASRRDLSKPVMRAKSFLQTAPVVRGFRPLENNDGTQTINRKVEKFERSSWQPSTSMTLPSTTKRDSFTTNQNVPFSRFNLKRTESKNEDFNCPSREQISQNVSTKSSQPPYENSQQNNGCVDSKSVIPKAPPLLPKTVQKKITNRQFVPVLDPRDELLKSIRDFGGKKGLRSRKA